MKIIISPAGIVLLAALSFSNAYAQPAENQGARTDNHANNSMSSTTENGAGQMHSGSSDDQSMGRGNMGSMNGSDGGGMANDDGAGQMHSGNSDGQGMGHGSIGTMNGMMGGNHGGHHM
jgi:hypothetical protein